MTDTEELDESEILRRGLETYAELGYAATTVRELARRLEVSRNFINDCYGYAASFLAPGSTLPTEDLGADILATDGAARTGILAGIEAGTFADEIRVVAELTRPVAVPHGEGEQLISLDYVEGLAMPTLWRGAVRILPGVGHAPHLEAPKAFAELLTRFIADLG